MNNSIEEIKRFQIDRGLNKQEYSSINEATNIIEEVLESLGYDVPKNKRKALIAQLLSFIGTLIETNTIHTVTNTTEDKVDAYADIIVFAIGAIMKLGYEPNEVLGETAKEINSRVGSMVGGKFEKDLSDEAKSNWYKANYDKCKVKD